MTIDVLPGDCLKKMRDLASESIDACVTDPPYHLTSIVKRFAKTSLEDTTKTSARARAGAEASDTYARMSRGFMGKEWDGGDVAFKPETWAEVLRLLRPGAYALVFSGSRSFDLTGAALRAAGFVMHPFIAWIFGSGFPKAHKIKADGWEGWRYGLQTLKPAIEPILMIQKPMSEKTGTVNVLKHSTGAINIDGCRISTSGPSPAASRRETSHRTGIVPTTERLTGTKCAKDHYAIGKIVNRSSPEKFCRERPGESLGRWPANLVHDGSEEVVETLGEASRFFYSAKADADDRFGSRHPTVKPIALMRWLVRLVTPPKGLVLDPFAGSGTTGVACLAEGFDCILIERETEYVADIEARLAWYRGEGKTKFEESARRQESAKDSGPLFAAGACDES